MLLCLLPCCSCRPSKDPRFDQTIGGKSFSNEAYSRRYAFLYDEVLPQERAALKQQLKVGGVFEQQAPEQLAVACSDSSQGPIL
jgi:hypothetical protein